MRLAWLPALFECRAGYWAGSVAGRTILGVAFLTLTSILTGCTPSIGDKCTLSTDCSTQGDRQCDTAQPDGYCTVFGCQGNLCPDEAACVLFDPSVPGCLYTDREPSRSARSACMKQCQQNSDCRTDEGYICADPKGAPWGALILDDDQGQHICIPAPYVSSDLTPIDGAAPVCLPDTPDAGTILMTPVDAGADAALDSGADAALDAGDAD